MNTVEKNITQKNVELMRSNAEFLKRQEREKKYVVPNLELVEGFKDGAVPIEQVYLSRPEDEFSLRVRAKYTTNGPAYTATLKDGGEVVHGSLNRLEVETPISQQAYEYYASRPDFPSIRKLRAEPYPGFTIDFIEGLPTPLVEIEERDGSSYPAYVEAMTNEFIDVTDDPAYLNESLAYERSPSSAEAKEVESLDQFVQRVAEDMGSAYKAGYQNVIVGISGMSGSGKSSTVAELARRFETRLNAELHPVVISTDDYHKGKKYLEQTYGAPWTNWDDPRVYDTALMAEDLKALMQGETINRRHFDFATEEVVIDGPITKRPFIIVEGLYAGSKDLADVRTLHYEVPTSKATSIGRDVRRLVLENRTNSSIGTPEERLRYQLEVALPTYENQDRPKRNFVSSCARPLAERAQVLIELRRLPADQ
jgi:uridine kinase